MLRLPLPSGQSLAPSEKRVVSFFLADGAVRAVPGINPQIIPQREKLRHHCADQARMISAGKIGAPY